MLSADFDRADMTNLCCSGAPVGDLVRPLEQVAAQHEHFDLVVVTAGSNDVLRLADWRC